MRKQLYLFLFALSLSMNANAWVRVPLTVTPEEGITVGHGYPKSPMRPPVVYIEDYTLAFVADHPEYILNIKDEAGEVIFTTIVYSTETQVTLPETLSGDYEIELMMGNWIFTGIIYI